MAVLGLYAAGRIASQPRFGGGASSSVHVGGTDGALPGRRPEQEGLDQNIELLGLEVVVAASPVEHEDCPSDRAVEVDRT
jgi:hypothetical protein